MTGNIQLAYRYRFYQHYPIVNALCSQLTNILTSKYQLYLPSEETLLEEIRDVLDLAEGGAVDG